MDNLETQETFRTDTHKQTTTHRQQHTQLIPLYIITYTYFKLHIAK